MAATCHSQIEAKPKLGRYYYLARKVQKLTKIWLGSE